MPEITSRLSTALADRYKIERHLGEGGMATVYLAQDLKHKRNAAAKVKQLLETNTQRGDALRVRVKAGGCSGLRYELAFDSHAAESDEQIEQRGVRLLVYA